jgi:hypothetical protein
MASYSTFNHQLFESKTRFDFFWGEAIYQNCAKKTTNRIGIMKEKKNNSKCKKVIGKKFSCK